jgi:hypothetical protein
LSPTRFKEYQEGGDASGDAAGAADSLRPPIRFAAGSRITAATSTRGTVFDPEK